MSKTLDAIKNALTPEAQDHFQIDVQDRYDDGIRAFRSKLEIVSGGDKNTEVVIIDMLETFFISGISGGMDLWTHTHATLLDKRPKRVQSQN